MNTQSKTAVSWFGVLVALPAVACVAFLAHLAFELDREALAAVFTLTGAAMLAASTRIK